MTCLSQFVDWVAYANELANSSNIYEKSELLPTLLPSMNEKVFWKLNRTDERSKEILDKLQIDANHFQGNEVYLLAIVTKYEYTSIENSNGSQYPFKLELTLNSFQSNKKLIFHVDFEEVFAFKSLPKTRVQIGQSILCNALPMGSSSLAYLPYKVFKVEYPDKTSEQKQPLLHLKGQSQISHSMMQKEISELFRSDVQQEKVEERRPGGGDGNDALRVVFALDQSQQDVQLAALPSPYGIYPMKYIRRFLGCKECHIESRNAMEKDETMRLSDETMWSQVEPLIHQLVDQAPCVLQKCTQLLKEEGPTEPRRPEDGVYRGLNEKHFDLFHFASRMLFDLLLIVYIFNKREESGLSSRRTPDHVTEFESLSPVKDRREDKPASENHNPWRQKIYELILFYFSEYFSYLPSPYLLSTTQWSSVLKCSVIIRNLYLDLFRSELNGQAEVIKDSLSQSKEGPSVVVLDSYIFRYIDRSIDSILDYNRSILVDDYIQQDWQSHSPYFRNLRVTYGLQASYISIRSFLFELCNISNFLILTYDHPHPLSANIDMPASSPLVECNQISSINLSTYISLSLLSRLNNTFAQLVVHTLPSRVRLHQIKIDLTHSIYLSLDALYRAILPSHYIKFNSIVKSIFHFHCLDKNVFKTLEESLSARERDQLSRILFSILNLISLCNFIFSPPLGSILTRLTTSLNHFSEKREDSFKDHQQSSILSIQTLESIINSSTFLYEEFGQIEQQIKTKKGFRVLEEPQFSLEDEIFALAGLYKDESFQELSVSISELRDQAKETEPLSIEETKDVFRKEKFNSIVGICFGDQIDALYSVFNLIDYFEFYLDGAAAAGSSDALDKVKNSLSLESSQPHSSNLVHINAFKDVIKTILSKRYELLDCEYPPLTEDQTENGMKLKNFILELNLMNA